jgi:hypothetical protein
LHEDITPHKNGTGKPKPGKELTMETKLINKQWMVVLEDENEIWALDEEHFGMCMKCGNDQYNCEPDATGYTCEACEKPAVYGVMHLAMGGRITYEIPE